MLRSQRLRQTAGFPEGVEASSASVPLGYVITSYSIHYTKLYEALDVTIQAQILDLLRRLQAERGMGMLLITHDLGVVAQMAHRIGVMYAGEIVEEAPREAFFSNPQHPYTQKLFAALPDLSRRGGVLETIAGQVPPLHAMPAGCRFAARCQLAWERCRRESIITSYSIHYTKLYDGRLHLPDQAAGAPAIAFADFRDDGNAHHRTQGTWRQADCGREGVITSYSIHYTKLYDKDHSSTGTTSSQARNV